MSEKAILLANLGSPDSYEVRDVKTYLNEFLMDERVIDIPWFFRFLLIRGILVPLRAPKSAKNYQSIWTDNGSPLIHITAELTKKVAAKTALPTYMCMRYASPTPQSALDKALEENPDLKEMVLVPLYPHYAMSSYETAVLHVKKAHREGNYPFSLSVVKPYYNHPDYIRSLAASIAPYLEKDHDHLLFSYHGVPERHIRKSDITGKHCLKCDNCCQVESPAHRECYRHQVIKTTHLVAKQLNIPEEKYSYSFQSRLGPDKWLEPFTADRFKKLPGEGIKKLLVVCPAFVSDCLETLEEIAGEGAEIFHENSGESFEMIPCLNLRSDWVSTIETLVKEYRE